MRRMPLSAAVCASSLVLSAALLVHADRRIRPQDPDAPKRLAVAGPAYVEALAASPDGTLVAAAQHQVLYVWDGKGGALLHRLEAAGGDQAVALAFAPQGDLVATAQITQNPIRTPYAENTAEVRLWDPRTGTWRGRLPLGLPTMLGLAFAPDGKTLYTGGVDGQIRLWAMPRGEEQAAFTAHSGAVGALAFTPDGKSLVSAGADGKVRFWDPATNALQRELTYTASLSSLALAPNGRWLAAGTCGPNEWGFRIWDLHSGEVRHTFSAAWSQPAPLARPMVPLSFTGDSALLLAAGDDGARVWDVAADRETRVLIQLPYPLPIRGTALKDSRVVVVAHGQGLQSWDLTAEALPQALQSPGRPHRAVLTPDQQRLITLDDQALCFWEVSSGKRTHHTVWQPSTNPNQIRRLALSADGRTLALRADSQYQLFDATTGKALAEPAVLKDLETILATGETNARVLTEAAGACFIADGKTVWRPYRDPRLIVDPIRSGRLEKLDVATGKVLAQVDVRTYAELVGGYAYAFSSDGKHLATGASDGTARIWDIATRKELQRIEVGHGDVRTISFADQDRRVMTFSEKRPVGGSPLDPGSQKLQVWELKTGKEVRGLDLEPAWQLRHARESATALLYTRQVGAGMAMETDIVAWDVDAKKSLGTWRVKGVHACSYSGDGVTVRVLLVEGNQWTVVIWDLASGKELRRFSRPAISTSPAFAISPDNRVFACVEGKGTGVLHCWDTETGKLRHQLPLDSYYPPNFASTSNTLAINCEGGTLVYDTDKGLVRCVIPDLFWRFAADGRHLSTFRFGAGSRTRLQHWDLETGKRVADLVTGDFFDGHDSVSAFQASPDGRLLLTGGGDRMARLWDAATGKQVRVFAGHQSHYITVAFLPDGKRCVTGSNDRTVRVWDLETGDQLQRFNVPGFVEHISVSADGSTLTVADSTGVSLLKLDK